MKKIIVNGNEVSISNLRIQDAELSYAYSSQETYGYYISLTFESNRLLDTYEKEKVSEYVMNRIKEDNHE